MQRNVYLEGELGERFGTQMCFEAPTVKDALKLIEVNNPSFRKYLIDCHEKGVQFHIDVAGEELEYNEELLLPLHEGDITITAVPEGAGSGFKKLLLAIAIIVVVVATGGFAGLGAAAPATTGWAVGAAGALSIPGMILVGFTMSLAMAGLTEMMAPDPSVDSDQEQSYLFNGAEQNIIEGDPVPVLYGQLRVPGRPIGFSIKNAVPNYGGMGANGVPGAGRHGYIFPF
tara:strand:- start:3460 stop:4146 length:687 start_codon:yes stop_codon:yes gene_type:complete